MARNPFRTPSEEEILKRKNDKETIEKQIASVIKLAGECLDDEKFKRYRDEFEEMRRDVFLKLATPMDPDPINDAHYLRSCINTIVTLDKLLSKPQRDLKRK